ncbi:site-specific integrase [Prosthecobacter sp.]|uniref:tyrosine-type recombinase/integrase n=1 Tax=Prosthecobacter sp. TaxID=1965333 RepID=UPI001DEF113F|nr:site-specific integrase [Prosthecobacter sp.]MCB1276448.1 site-specific integrase [Prosthecobacter sp.]
MIYKRKRRINGVVKEAKTYTARIRLHKDDPMHEVPLNTSDKQIAQQRLAEMVREMEMEKAGMLPPKSIREASKKPLKEHLNYHLDLQESRNVCAGHIFQIRSQMLRLFEACGWKTLKDITASGFESWRAKTHLSAKTKNNYLHCLSCFMKDMEQDGRIMVNEVRRIRPVKTAGKETFERGALSPMQFDKLVSVSGERAIVYLTAGLTGLRKNELRLVEVRDLNLDAIEPYIRARASTTKNSKEAFIPLTRKLAGRIKEIVPANARPQDRVFESRISDMPTYYKDLEAAGIPSITREGKRIDFHSLRKTFGTLLALAGVPPQIAQRLMRHSDPKLTCNIYTDAGLLPINETIHKLGSLMEEWTHKWTQMDTQKLVPDGHSLSASVHAGSADGSKQVPGSEAVEAAFVLMSPSLSNVVGWCAVQGSNL